MGQEQVKPVLAKYLAFKGWKWQRVDANNIAIKTCPFCGKDKWKFHIHRETTQWRCFGGCPKTGNLYSLKKDLGDIHKATNGVTSAANAAGGEPQKNYKTVPMEHVLRWHDDLINNPEKLALVMAWRGFSEEAIFHFKLGVRRWKPKPYTEAVWWLCIPHINDKTCHNVKFRTLPDSDVKKDFRRVGGYASVLYNADCLRKFEEVIVAEAETDTISWWDAGIRNIVGLTCGADTFLSEWYDQLVDKDKILTALDPDGPGQLGARDIARRIGFGKCWNIMFPDDTDANKLYKEEGRSALTKLVSAARQFDIIGVQTLDQVLQEAGIAREHQEPGLITQWSNVNRKMGDESPQGGDLVVVSATPKTGKTSYCLAWAVFQARLGIPSLMYCLEMKTRRLADKITAALRDKDVGDLTPVDYQMARYEMRDLPLYFIDPRVRNDKGKISAEFCLNKIKEVVRRYGIKFCVFDHLHFLCRSLDNITTEVGRTCKDFKLTAEELEIVMCLIAQPKKLQTDRPPTANDLKHSGDIWADADLIKMLWRKRILASSTGDLDAEYEEDEDRESMESKMLVRIDAARFAGGGDAYLEYIGARSQFNIWDQRQATY